MKRISALLVGLLLTGVFTLSAWAAGTLTTNKFIYKPSAGASGELEKKTFDAGLDRIDARLGKEIWVGDPNYGTTLQDAITAIGTTNKTILRIPAGAWAITSYLAAPANITLKFENGAYLDLAGLKDAAIEDMSLAAACKVTMTGHGLQTGDKIRFYGIRQNYVSGTTHTGEWMGFNNQIYTVTRIDDDNFTIPVNTSAFHAYVPATDPGRACVPIVVKNILAGKQKIFNVAAPAHVCFADSYAGFISVLDPRKQQEVYPEWFGAVGDGVTDDLLALNAAKLAMTYYDKMQGILKLSNWYGISSTFSLNETGLSDHGTVHVEGTGRTVSGFVGLAACAGKPVVEIVGTGGVRLKSFGFTGITPAYSPVPDDAPSVALMLGRSQFNPNAGGNRFEDLGFWGFYQYGVIFNFGFATSQWSHCEANVSALTGKVTNNWMFSFFLGAGTDIYGTLSLPSWGAALVPTNATWRSGSNCSADGNTISDFYMVANGTKLTGNAGIYLSNTPGVTLERVGLGGLADYYVYALDAVFSIRDSGGDGHYTVAGAYVASSTATSRTIRVQNFMPVVDSGIVLQTDGNTTLVDSVVDQISQGKIVLGRGATNSRFTGLHLLSAFSNAGGYLVNNLINLPVTCLVSPDFIGAVSTGNIIQSNMTADPVTTLTGDVRIGYPGQATPSKLILDPYTITWSAAAPTTGSYAQGSVIWKIGAPAGTSPGWNCRLDNTFGTLNSGATTGTITTGTKILTVNSVTGLTVGNFIDVVADGGGNAVTAGRIVNIDSTNKIVTLYANATATATATVVSFHNHTTAEAFEAMPSTLARTSGVTSAATSPITVTHGLGTTPTKVLLTSVDGVPTGIYPNTFGTTTFTINYAGGGSHAFYWEAIQ